MRRGQAGRWVAAVAAGWSSPSWRCWRAGFRPGHAIPAGADRAAGLRLAAGLRALGGTVAVPADPALALMAGLPAVEDQFAAADVLRASDRAAKADLHRAASRARWPRGGSPRSSPR